MRNHKAHGLGILIGMLLLMVGSAASAALPPRISWTPAQLTPASMAPGTSTSHTVVLKHTGILPIPFTNQLRIVAEGAIAPFVTITQPQFPPVFKRGNQVTVPITVSVPTNTPTGKINGTLVLKRILPNGKEKEVWRAEALPLSIQIVAAPSGLAPPSDPRVINIGTGTDTITVNTLLYDGQVDIPLPPGKTMDSLSVVSGLNEATPISADGHFKTRLNAKATALLRVKDSGDNTILLQLFPKGDGLVKVNPIIDATSTAVAIVALRPGVITTDPLLDILILAMIERIPETKLLADQISYEISQGTFRLNGNYSKEVEKAIESVLVAAATLTPDDMIATNFLDKLILNTNKLASKFISPAYADSAFVEQCSDNFNLRFKGDAGNPDEVCISASEAEPGNPTNFNLWNRKTRFVFWSILNSGNVNPITLISPRHLDFGLGIVDTLAGAAKLIGASLVDTASMLLNYKEYIKGDSQTNIMLNESFNKRFGVQKTQAEHIFQNQGEYSLATLGSASSPVSNPNFEQYSASSFLLTSVTELAIPLVSVIIDVAGDDLTKVFENKSPGINACLASSSDVLLYFSKKIAFLKTKSNGSENNTEMALAMAGVLVDDILLNDNVWTLYGCLFKNIDSYIIGQFGVKKAINELFGSSVGMVSKIASSAETVLNLGLFLKTTVFDDELASEDFYTLLVGNPPPTTFLGATPNPILQGANTTLTWSSTNSTSCTLSGFPINGSINGSITFAPTVTTNYTLQCTGDGGTSSTNVTVKVDPVIAANNNPTAADDTVDAQSGVSTSIDVLANDTDADNDIMTIESVTQGANGTVTKNSSSVTYTSNDGFVGTDTFTYTITDSPKDGSGSDTATVTVNVTSIVPPSTWSITPASVSVSESSGTVTFTLSRTNSTAAQTVFVSTVQDQGSTNNGDYVGKPNEAVPFAAGQVQQTVTVTINDDTAQEGNETFGLIVQESSSDPINTNLASATFTLVDNDTPNAAGLVAYYSLDGNASDLSGNGRDGTAYGGTSYVNGVTGQAASFDGVDDYIDLPDKLLSGETYTISLFVKVGEGNLRTDKPYMIFDGWTNSEIVGLQYGENLYYAASAGIVGNSDLGNYLIGNFHPTYSETILYGERHLFHKVDSTFKEAWHHVVLSYDGNIARYYLDGTLLYAYTFDSSVQTYPGSITRTDSLSMLNYSLGASMRHMTFFSGAIDEVRIYNRAISEEEIFGLGFDLNPPVPN